ncbi:MAG: hypothetical protein ACFFD4_09905 [Candidatus Odinarchaeota archaeon]
MIHQESEESPEDVKPGIIRRFLRILINSSIKLFNQNGNYYVSISPGNRFIKVLSINLKPPAPLKVLTEHFDTQSTPFVAHFHGIALHIYKFTSPEGESRADHAEISLDELEEVLNRTRSPGKSFLDIDAIIDSASKP